MLNVKNLSLSIKKELVKDISFHIDRKEMFALIGESGSGKSLTALAIMRLLPAQATYSKQSQIIFEDQDLLNLTERQMRNIRGNKISMIFQDPMTSLNPVMTIGSQLTEVLRVHGKDTQRQAIHLLDAVKIPDVTRRVNNYPHELSGGMKQRVMIAIALACKPSLLIADEPTTALDVTTQAEILSLLKELAAAEDMAVMLITHDLAIASQNAGRIAVMQNGKFVEQNSVEQFFAGPKNDYSKKLLDSLPNNMKIQTDKISSGTIMKVRDLQVYYPIKQGLFRRTVDHVKAVDKVSFTVARGETLAIVGESGSGKTTVGRALIDLIPNVQGTIETFSDRLQIIFQDPYSSLDPKMRIFDSLTEGINKKLNKEQIVDKLLQQVGLLPEHKWRYPHEFSGGERQRICIARALSVKPEIIICDEPTSSLDVSVQAQVLKLLVGLQAEHNLTYIFITHDISLVRLLAQRVLVMYKGKIVEYGSALEVLQNPQHQYTKELLAAVPMIS